MFVLLACNCMNISLYLCMNEVLAIMALRLEICMPHTNGMYVASNYESMQHLVGLTQAYPNY